MDMDMDMNMDMNMDMYGTYECPWTWTVRGSESKHKIDNAVSSASLSKV